MSDTVIRVENLSKKYVLSHQQNQANYKTLRETLTNSTRSLGRRFSKSAEKTNATREEFWALKDVSFEIKQGDRVGIIGRNGAGKSTLLKVLSRIMEPTSGSIRIKGRIASLLEVGTGFHPELTGRENIFLNGAILGMSKIEIQNKFDEIVAFSEVEKFLDTPVKRYSSGMYVRLAFAVAAHLEPEVLIVDEVLAVGDATFQKKCLGKMKDVSQEGRTILFVSHNMPTMRALCNRALFMKQGQLLLDSNMETAIQEYLLEDRASDARIIWDEKEAPQTSEIRLMEASILNSQGEFSTSIDVRKGFTITVKYEVLKPIVGLRIGFFMQNSEGIPICGSNTVFVHSDDESSAGEYTTKCDFPDYVLNAGRYSVRFGVDAPPYSRSMITSPFCLTFEIEDVEGHGITREKLPGIVRPKLTWKTHQLKKLEK